MINILVLFTNQFAIAFAAHLLCALHLHTSHDSPCDVTEIRNCSFIHAINVI